MTRNILVAALLAVGYCAAQPVMAQSLLSNCSTVEVAERLMTEGFGEHVFWEGLLANNQVVIQAWNNPETGTWSLVAILPDGTACIFADGFIHTFVDPPIPGNDM